MLCDLGCTPRKLFHLGIFPAQEDPLLASRDVQSLSFQKMGSKKIGWMSLVKDAIIQYQMLACTPVAVNMAGQFE